MESRSEVQVTSFKLAQSGPKQASTSLEVACHTASPNFQVTKGSETTRTLNGWGSKRQRRAQARPRAGSGGVTPDCVMYPVFSLNLAGFFPQKKSGIFPQYPFFPRVREKLGNKGKIRYERRKLTY